MKKLLSLASSTLLFLGLNAQITIDANDLPQPGSSYVLQESTPDPLSDYSETGANFSWDYSQLDSNGEVVITIGDLSDASDFAQGMFNNAFLFPDYVCYAFGPGDFPDFSQLGVELPIALGEMNNFYQIDESFNIAGITMNLQGMDIPVQYSDIDEVYPLPMNYGDELESTHAFAAELPNVLTYSSAGNRSVSVDGWGSIQLPNDEEYEVLRVTSTKDINDSIEFQGQIIPFSYSITSHQWLAPQAGVPVLEVNSMFGAAYRVRYLGDAPEVDDTSNTEGISGIAPTPLKIFPNPVTNGGIVNLGIENNNSIWEVVDSNGKIVATGTGSKIQTNAIESGIYFVICRESGLEPTVLVVQ